jgi:pSer/pThr/pTyr-binding forkhead associated (FHA) protein
MIICHNCGKNQLEGAIFCDECGTKLIDVAGLTTQSISSETPAPDLLPLEDQEPHGQKESEISLVKLVVLKSGVEILLAGQDDFTLGRTSDGQSIIPDIDLSPYNAFQEGVSRIHASIKVVHSQVSLVDLASINGTLINDHKIPPNIYHPLQGGDIITLGRMRLQVIFET